jgi:hypothetical protein
VADEENDSNRLEIISGWGSERGLNRQDAKDAEVGGETEKEEIFQARVPDLDS